MFFGINSLHSIFNFPDKNSTKVKRTERQPLLATAKILKMVAFCTVLLSNFLKDSGDLPQDVVAGQAALAQGICGASGLGIKEDIAPRGADGGSCESVACSFPSKEAGKDVGGRERLPHTQL